MAIAGSFCLIKLIYIERVEKMSENKTSKQTTKYSDTVLLPKTDFPMRAGLPKKEPLTLEFWNKMDLYKSMLEARKDAPRYTLHDGPPYANGHIHIGHAMNKILKDFVVKSTSMMGYYSAYTPGWDCHGLPIEHALLKELKTSKRNISDIPAFRKKAREFAQKFVDIQREEFKRLGVLGYWETPYLTMSPDYEATVISAFYELLKKGFIHRGKRSVYWCTCCETALADAEVEYKDKTSNSIYVAFKLDNPAKEVFGDITDKPISLVIWTTTPWTIPANKAAAVAAEEDYQVLKGDSEYYVVAKKLAQSFLESTGLDFKPVSEVSGQKLVGLTYQHPLMGVKNSVISTDFVAMDTGSGIVHIAPGHGEDDFKAGVEHGIEVFCPVDEQGKFTKQVPQYVGRHVFETNKDVMNDLKKIGKLLGSGDISHSYPHCWRCKQPIIFRATEQWFLGIDKNELRTKILSEVEKVNWIASSGKERMRSMIEQRPDWCLSRQRYWGTPVAVIYCKECDKLQVDDELFKVIVDRTKKENSDFWFSLSAEELLPKGYKCQCGSTSFRKETDILDVWLDSGVSWKAVLTKRENHNYPSEVYMEGSDQHRGWFQSSLIPSVALNGFAPYKNVLTHGFVLDDKGKAMHKSLGNVVAPEEVIKKYGAEILRLWVALSDYLEDIRLSDKLLEGPIDMYRKIRNTLRYLLANLFDYNPKTNMVSDDKLLEMDRYMRNLFNRVSQKVQNHYSQFKYRHAMRTIADFCILDLSSFYLDSLKDRLYTLGTDSLERRSAQTVLSEIASGLLKLMAPILSFTAEEAWQELKKLEMGKDFSQSIFLSDFEDVKNFKLDSELLAKWEEIRSLRDRVLKALEESRQKGEIGSSLQAKVIFHVSDEKLERFLSENMELWPSIAIVSKAELVKSSGEKLKIEVKPADGEKCPRCWQWHSDIGQDSEYSDVCLRCASVLKADKK
jgi:isoleucyl-tRNA synthetase